MYRRLVNSQKKLEAAYDQLHSKGETIKRPQEGVPNIQEMFKGIFEGLKDEFLPELMGGDDEDDEVRENSNYKVQLCNKHKRDKDEIDEKLLALGEGDEEGDNEGEESDEAVEDRPGGSKNFTTEIEKLLDSQSKLFFQHLKKCN